MLVSAGLGFSPGLEGRILPASSTFLMLQAFLGLWPSRPLLHPPVASSCVSVLSLPGRQSWGIRAHPKSSSLLIPSAKTVLVPFPHEATF